MNSTKLIPRYKLPFKSLFRLFKSSKSTKPVITHDAKVVTLQPKTRTTTYIKPWRSDPSKINRAVSVELKHRPDQYFEAVYDQEPGYISIHFKTDGQKGKGSLTQQEKQVLFTGLNDIIPEGYKISTYGSVSPGGVHGLNRLARENGYIQVGTRMVQDKAGNALEIPVFQKPFKKELQGIEPESTFASYREYPSEFGGTDLFEKMMYNHMIMGRPMLGTRSPGLIEKGLRSADKEHLMRETFERNAAEARKHGYTEREINNLKERYNTILDEVKVGYFPGSTYKSAGVENYGGFYNDADSFISVNMDNAVLPIRRIVGHEGRHALDYGTTMLPHQEKILGDAYDDLFETIPESEYSKGLEDYINMKREKVTTNLDSRDVLFDEILAGRMSNSSLAERNRIIDAMPDDRIFEAVEKANGYGRRYIQRLRDLHRLTPEKAKQFKKAMKHVGMLIPGVPWLLYNQPKRQ